MRPAALFPVALAASLAVLGGCPGGAAGLGEACDRNGDCASEYQCAASVCVPRCQRAPECGDGFWCTVDGLCVAATGQTGDACRSETDCAAGLACQLDGSAAGSDGMLLATCGAATGERPADAACDTDADCRNGTCGLGRCIDLCDATADDGARACAAADTCTVVPRVGAGSGAQFGGCLPAHATITWAIPVGGPQQTIAVPVPANARSIALSLEVDDTNEEVGARLVDDPAGHTLFDLTQNMYGQAVRHAPGFAQSVLEMPSNPDIGLRTGIYEITVESLRAPFNPAVQVLGSSTPRVTVVAKLGASDALDLHFYFLDFTDHPCAASMGPDKLSATTASTAQFFQTDYLDELRRVFALGGISLQSFTYEDVTDHHELDGLDVNNASALFKLGAHAAGINVFFVRSLSPVGLQTFGPNPGPAGLADTPQSGIVVGLDTLCYRTWPELARLTAHELAHYMGLYDNVVLQHPDETDPISDDDGSRSSNLMFYSELQQGSDLSAGHGVDLSAGQQDILARSAVLR